MRALAYALLLVGCAAPATSPPEVTDPTDDDQDGIPDQLESQLMERFGPELRLPPDDIDWTRPANVDWYLRTVGRGRLARDNDGSGRADVQRQWDTRTEYKP
jgi:hypothetical protein